MKYNIEPEQKIYYYLQLYPKYIYMYFTLGASLLAHPGEDASGDVIVVSAPRCSLLRATEELGLCKPYLDGNMAAFSFNDRDNFKDSGIYLYSAKSQHKSSHGTLQCEV